MASSARMVPLIVMPLGMVVIITPPIVSRLRPGSGAARLR
jgi:hypothetical protein